MPTSDKPRLNIVVGPRLRSDLRRLSDAQETTVSQVTRDALRREIRKKDLITRARPTILPRKGNNREMREVSGVPSPRVNSKTGRGASLKIETPTCATGGAVPFS
jgi:hypothetical protein